MSNADAATFEGVTLELGSHRVLNNVSLSVPAGEFVGILGPNGAGKTTLMRSILGLTPTSHGSIFVLGRPASRGNIKVGYMPQLRGTSTIVAILAGSVGYFLVLRGQTFPGHALAHVGFTEATGAVLIGAPPLAGLVVMSVTAGAAMGAMGEKLAQRDIAIGVVLSLTLGIGLLFLHFLTTSATQATALLFGNVLAVSVSTIQILLALAAISLAVLGVIACIPRTSPRRSISERFSSQEA